MGMSQYFGRLKVGDNLALQGPVGMIAGGTGITPMYQIVSAALADAGDKTTWKLIFANQTEGDILIRSELEALAAKHPDRFSLHYTLDRPPSKWAGSTGFITQD